MPGVQVLGVADAVTRTVDLSERRPSERDTTFEDWTIDETPLRRLVADRWGVSGLPSELTRLWPEAPRAAVAGLRTLLGECPPDFDDGRVALLVCPVDQDINCRALGARVVLGRDTVEWQDVGWQVDYERFDPTPDEYGLLPTYAFDRRQYEEQVRELLRRYAALAAAAPPPAPSPERRRWFRRSR